MDDKKILMRLKQQYKIYEEELDEINEHEDGMIDISVSCALANSIPFLIKKIEQQQQEIEELKQVANDLNNDLFHERVEKDKLEQKIEKLKNELDRQMQIGYSFEGKVVDQQKEIKRLKAFHQYFHELYGLGLELANWHSNDELEPFDNFFDSAEEEMNN